MLATPTETTPRLRPFFHHPTALSSINSTHKLTTPTVTTPCNNHAHPCDHTLLKPRPLPIITRFSHAHQTKPCLIKAFSHAHKPRPFDPANPLKVYDLAPPIRADHAHSDHTQP